MRGLGRLIRGLGVMHSYAGGGWTTLWKLRVLSALPYIFTALKIAAPPAWSGRSSGSDRLDSKGLGGAIINFNQYYVLEPENLWATNLYAAPARDPSSSSWCSPRSSLSTRTGAIV